MDKTDYSSRNADKFVVRLPKGMRTRISEVAKRYHRSMNSEIVSRLEDSLRTEVTPQVDLPEEIILEDIDSELENQLITRIKELNKDKQKALLLLLDSD